MEETRTMRLRRLKKKDIPYMLEWMHDSEINQYFRFDAAGMTEEKAKEFVSKSFDDKNKHYAIVDEKDEYLGTVSLKNINSVNRDAEYAVSVRKQYHGSGVAVAATNAVLKIAFEELDLCKVYLNVLSQNIRAIRFYEKLGFKYVKEEKNSVLIGNQFHDLMWYEMQKGDLE